MTELALIASGALVWLVTQGVKRVQAIDLNPKKKTYIRLLVALFSFGAALGGATLVGVELDPTSIDAFVNALVVFLSSQGIHLLSKDTE